MTTVSSHLAGIHVTLHENQDGTVDVVVSRGEWTDESKLSPQVKRVKIFIDSDTLYDGTEWFDEEGRRYDDHRR